MKCRCGAVTRDSDCKRNSCGFDFHVDPCSRVGRREPIVEIFSYLPLSFRDISLTVSLLSRMMLINFPNRTHNPNRRFKQ